MILPEKHARLTNNRHKCFARFCYVLPTGTKLLLELSGHNVNWGVFLGGVLGIIGFRLLGDVLACHKQVTDRYRVLRLTRTVLCI